MSTINLRFRRIFIVRTLHKRTILADYIQFLSCLVQLLCPHLSLMYAILAVVLLYFFIFKQPHIIHSITLLYHPCMSSQSSISLLYLSMYVKHGSKSLHVSLSSFLSHLSHTQYFLHAPNPHRFSSVILLHTPSYTGNINSNIHSTNTSSANKQPFNISFMQSHPFS